MHENREYFFFKINIANNLLLKKVGKFILTGFLVTIIHILVAIWLIETKDIHPSISNFVAFILSTLIGYSVNSIWTFNHKVTSKNLMRYIMVSIFCSIIAVGISQLIYFLTFHYLVGISLIVTTVPWISFYCHQKFTFKKDN